MIVLDRIEFIRAEGGGIMNFSYTSPVGKERDSSSKRISLKLGTGQEVDSGVALQVAGLFISRESELTGEKLGGLALIHAGRFSDWNINGEVLQLLINYNNEVRKTASGSDQGYLGKFNRLLGLISRDI